MSLRAIASADEPLVREWLDDFWRAHVRAWTERLGLAWSEERIAAHVAETELVAIAWSRLARAAEDPAQLVRVACGPASSPRGIVHAQASGDRYLRLPVGAIEWVYVAASARRQGVGRRLVDAALAWVRGLGFELATIQVSVGNRAAQALYEAAGFAVTDRRLLVTMGGSGLGRLPARLA